MYHGFARSAGFNYWESAGYTFAGSALWEIAGETTQPSSNDQIASGIGGTFLGEALFRMSNLMLEHGGGMPRFWRELAAAVISPSTGFNRLVFGDRYGAVFSSNDAAYYSRLGIGYSRSVREEVGVTSTQVPAQRGAGRLLDRLRPAGQEELRVHAAVRLLQLPGDGVERERLRERADARPAGRQVVRGRRRTTAASGASTAATTTSRRRPSASRAPALSLGTTGHLWLTHDLSLEGTGMLGVGYTAVGTANGTASTDRDYNYGVTPQALLALRLTYGDRASLDVTGREYFVSKRRRRERAAATTTSSASTPR